MLTLYDKYGGFSVISKLVQAFYEKVLASDNLAPYFEDINMQKLMDHQAKFFSDILGGPVEYTGRELKVAHAGLGITEDDFIEMSELIEETLEDMNIDDSDIQTVMKIVNDSKGDIVTVASASE